MAEWYTRTGSGAKLAAAYRRIRERALTILGGHCACCGESQREFLTIDHIYGGGVKHRKRVSAKKLLTQIHAEPEQARQLYRILCWNCNGARGANGYCPHEHDRDVAVGSL
jgi:hypothetical protein